MGSCLGARDQIHRVTMTKGPRLPGTSSIEERATDKGMPEQETLGRGHSNRDDGHVRVHIDHPIPDELL